MEEEKVDLIKLPKLNVMVMAIGIPVYGLLFGILVWVIEPFRATDQVAPRTLFILIIVGLLVSALALSAPWRLPRFFGRAFAAPISTRRAWSATIVTAFAPLIAPQIYGLVLYFLGMSLMGFIVFVGASIAVTLLWAAQNLRSP